MIRHPEPPETPRALRILVTRLRGSFLRSYSLRHDPLYFGKTAANRFDAPAGEFGVCYLARDRHGAFIETFGHETGVRFVTEAQLRERGLARVALADRASALRLVDLRGEGLARIGADASLVTGLDLELARRWSLALHAHPRRPDGILYRARHDPARESVALFDRAAGKARVRSRTPWLDPSLHEALGGILDTYDFGLLS
jgi:hypothetical protein